MIQAQGIFEEDYDNSTEEELLYYPEQYELKRSKHGCVLDTIILDSFEGLTDDVALGVEENAIVLQPLDVDSTQTAYFIGNEFYIIANTKVKLQVIFYDEGFCIDVKEGFINTGTVDDPYLYGFQLTEADHRVLNSTKAMQYHKVTSKELFELMTYSTTGEYETMETLFEMEIKFERGAFSAKPLAMLDLSNGKVDELKAEQQQKEEQLKLEKEKARQQQLLADERREQERLKKEQVKAHSQPNNQMARDMFANLLGKGI